VSGTAEAPVPVDLDALDLLAPARAAAAGVARRGDWWQTPGGDPDQIGHLPVAMELDGYVEALRDHRNKGEGRPDPDTAVLCRWLLDRLDDAAVDWPVIAELFTKVRELWAALRGSLGEYDGHEYHKGIPCPRCSMLTLIRKPASDFITCEACPAYLSIPEFEEHVKSMSVEALAAKKRAAAVVKLLRDLHAVGWWHHAQIDVEGSGADRNVFTFHYWRRGGERLYLSAHRGSGPYGPIDYRHVDEEGFGPDGVTVAVDWVATHGVAHLRRLASAAGVLSVPKERAA
jgi:hypothetical protein